MKTTSQAIQAMAESEGDCYPHKALRKMRRLIMKAIQEQENQDDRNRNTGTGGI